jgi:hypothetical protein
MKSFRSLTALLLTLGILFVNVPTVLAVPPLPSSFYGTVKYNGGNVPIGFRVSARINGIKYALSPFILHNGDTAYHLDVPGDDSETPDVIEGGVSGDIVTFYVGTTQADQTATWHGGTNVALNLTVPSLPKYWLIYLPLVKR